MQVNLLSFSGLNACKRPSEGLEQGGGESSHIMAWEKTVLLRADYYVKSD